MIALTKTLTLQVTQAAIDGAVFGCSTCPVARALEARGFGASVGDRSATISMPEPEPLFPGAWLFAEYRLPHRARRIIHDFDAGLPVQVASFRITRMDS